MMERKYESITLKINDDDTYSIKACCCDDMADRGSCGCEECECYEATAPDQSAAFKKVTVLFAEKAGTEKSDSMDMMDEMDDLPSMEKMRKTQRKGGIALVIGKED